MRFPAYPDYKNSGIEWAIELPAHWKTVALKWVSRIYAGGTPDKNKTHYWEDGSIPWLNSGAVNQVLITEPSSYITDEAFKSSSAKWIPADSLVIALAGQGKTKGMVAQLAIETTCNQSMAAIISDSSVVSRYLFWWLSSNYQNIRNMAGGDLRDGLNLELIGNISAPVPTEAEQTQIARFLDHETARIDALIEEQQRLIELLKEKRQAVISRAVTRGLDPTVPMKDSDVEWLGKVPVHWDVVPTNYRYEIQLGRMLNEQRTQGDHLKPYLRVFDVQWNAINTTDLPLMDFPPEVQPLYRLRVGDLMVNEGGSYVGRSAIWRGDLGECYYQKALHRLRPRDAESDTAEFFLYVMEMATQQGVFVAGGNQTTIDHLTAEQLRQYRFAFPPLEEQLYIAEGITVVVARIQKTISEAELLICLLQERRSALISAAVTGKIDVRGWHHPASASTPELAQEAV